MKNATNKQIEAKPAFDPDDSATWVTTTPTSEEVRQRLTKPAVRIEPPGREDLDVIGRVARALQDSALHVFAFHGLAADPDQPEREDIAIFLSLAAITDGVRGFLVLADDFAPPRSDSELLEFMEGVYNGDDADAYVTRVAEIFATPYDTEPTGGALDLRDPSAARRLVEQTYAEAFEGKAPIDHGAFVRGFTRLNHGFQDETKLRAFYKLLDDC